MRNETNGKNIGPILPACCFVDSTVLWIFFPFLFTINIFQMTKKKKKNPFFHPFSFVGTQILSVSFNAMLLELLSGFF